MITLFTLKGTSPHRLTRLNILSLSLSLIFSASAATPEHTPPSHSSKENSVQKEDKALKEAAEFVKKGQLDVANSIYQRYAKQHPDSLDAQLGLASIAIRWRDYGTAEILLNKANKAHPDSLDTLIMLGRLHLERAQGAHTLKVEQAKINAGRKDMNKAAKFIEQARTIAPQNAEIITQAGQLAFLNNDLVETERQLQSALKVNPGYVPAFQTLIQFYIKTRDYERARDASLHALELDANDPVTYYMVAQLMASSDQPGEAIRYALRSEKLDFGRLPERNALLAQQYDKLGDTRQALRYYRELLQDTPNDGDAWLRMANLHQRLGEGSAATESFRQAVVLNIRILEDMAQKARVASRSDDAKEALTLWRRVITVNPATAAPNNKDITTGYLNAEALSTIAGLHLRERFNHPEKAPEGAEQDRALFAGATGDIATMDLAKLDLATNPQERASDIRSIFQTMQTNQNPAIAGEASFLLEQMEQTEKFLDTVDALSAEDYTFWGDRLLMDQELVYSKVFYQRAYELNKDASVLAAISRIDVKKEAANRKIQDGNALFAVKDYQGALVKYRQARVLNRQSDSVYLRLGDTYEKLKQWLEARQAYDSAVSLSPSLLSSPGFVKHYDYLKKKSAHSIDSLR